MSGWHTALGLLDEAEHAWVEAIREWEAARTAASVAEETYNKAWDEAVRARSAAFEAARRARDAR